MIKFKKYNYNSTIFCHGKQNPDPQKCKKKIQLNIFIYIFLFKNCNLLIPRPP
jgi:hypothetical protein